MLMFFDQPRRVWKGLQGGLGIVATLLFLSPSISFAESHPWRSLVGQLCVPLGVPQALVLALIDTESKGNSLAVNIAQKGSHHGYLPQHLKQARTLLDDGLKQTSNVGVGLLQITYRYHQAAMEPDPHRFFDPVTNLSYGCQVLAGLLNQPGPLWKRIGMYHSASNLGRQQGYAKRVLKRMMRYLNPQTGGERG